MKSYLDIYNEIFVKVFEVKLEELANLKYQDVDLWDSVGHMNLMAELEEAFEIMIDIDDMIDFSSYNKGKDILKKYGIEI
jgi:acyl carrier protein